MYVLALSASLQLVLCEGLCYRCDMFGYLYIMCKMSFYDWGIDLLNFIIES